MCFVLLAALVLTGCTTIHHPPFGSTPGASYKTVEECHAANPETKMLCTKAPKWESADSSSILDGMFDTILRSW